MKEKELEEWLIKDSFWAHVSFFAFDVIMLSFINFKLFCLVFFYHVDMLMRSWRMHSRKSLQ